MKGTRNAKDEMLIEILRNYSGNQESYMIIDSRPYANVLGNKYLLGAGVVNINNYPNCQLTFLGIENIHVMKSNLSKLINLLKSSYSENGILNFFFFLFCLIYFLFINFFFIFFIFYFFNFFLFYLFFIF